jgi:hypothetical protein
MANLYGQRTLAQIETEIGQNLFGQTALSTSTYPTLAHADQVINKWYKRVYSKYWPLWALKSSTLTLSQGTTNYTMPDTVQTILGMQIRDLAYRITHLDQQTFLQMYPMGWTNFGQAVPLYWINGTPANNNALTVDFFPTPNATYTVHYQYIARFAELSSGPDISVIPPEYDDILVHGPLAEFFTMLGDPRAAYHQGEADKIMFRLWQQTETTRDNENPDQGAYVIHPYWDYR